MTEALTVIAYTGLRKTAIKTLSYTRIRLVRWFLKKYAPLKPEHLLIDFDSAPQINLNSKDHLHKLSFLFNIRNLTPYDLILHSCTCKISINSYGFTPINKAGLLNLKFQVKGQYELEKSLTPQEVEWLEDKFRDQKSINAYFEFVLSIQNNSEFDNYHIPPKQQFIQLLRH